METFEAKNKRKGLNKHTGWKKHWKSSQFTVISTKQSHNFCLKVKSNKRTVPNKNVLVGKFPEINKRTPYVY